MGAPVQYAVQILVNSGRPSEYWRFDDDFPVRDNLRSARSDLDEASAYGYAPEHIRLVAISVVTSDQDEAADEALEDRLAEIAAEKR